METTQQVLHRTVRLAGDEDDCHFASVDGGGTWIELDRAPTQGDRDDIREMMEGTVDPDTGMRTGLITVSNRYFGIMAPSSRVGEIQVAASERNSTQ